MALFSSNAVENGTLQYREIYDAYRQTLSEKIYYYRIEGMTISLDRQSASVAGTYELSRKVPGEARSAKFSGKIAWRIERQNGDLKIVSMAYDR